MFLNKRFLGLFAASIIMLGSAVPSDAKGAGGSSSGAHVSSSSGGFSKPSVSTSSSFSKPSSPAPSAPPSSGGFSKPGAPSGPVAAPAPSNGGFSKPGAPSTTQAQPVAAAPRPAAPPSSVLNTASSKTMSSNSLKAYQAERSGTTRPPQPVPPSMVQNNSTYSNASRAWGGNVDNYYARRTTVITTYHTSYPSVFVVSRGLYPNYGIYDSGFLTGMFMGYMGASMIHNASWLAAQQSQPWYPSYRADLERQAETNAELREKIALMDAEIARQRAAGNVAQPGSLPQGVDPAFAMAPEAVISATPDRPAETPMWVWVLASLAAVIGGGLLGIMMRR